MAIRIPVYRLTFSLFRFLSTDDNGINLRMALSAIDKNTPIFKPAFEYQESTLQLPFGEFSIFSDLKANRVSPLEAMVTLTLCYRSNWSTGLTWRTSSRQLSDLIHLSHRYIRDALQKRHNGSSGSVPRKATPPAPSR